MRHRADFTVNGAETIGSKIRTMLIISVNPHADSYPYELGDATKQELIKKFVTDLKLSEETATAMYEDNEAYLRDIGALVDCPLKEEYEAEVASKDYDQETSGWMTMYNLVKEMIDSKGKTAKEDVLSKFRREFPDRNSLLYYETVKSFLIIKR